MDDIDGSGTMREEDTDAHSSLIQSIKNLDRKRKVKNVKSVAKKVDGLTLDELISSIPDNIELKELKRDLKSAAKLRPLIHDSSKEQKNKIQRGIAFKETREDLNRWQPIIDTNRLKEQLVFPLEQDRHRMMTVAETVQVFRPLTTLEIEMDKVLKNSKNNLTNKDELTESEKELVKAMSLKEANEKRSKLQKIRALMTYQEVKFKRQKKIKSKNFHRLQKREKRKQILKEFEELREKDPESAREKLEMLERDRILERATLRHRGTNQWAKEIRQHAKRDPKTREALQQQLRMSRELQEKRDVLEVDKDSSEEEGDKEDDTISIQKLIDSVDQEDIEKREKFLGSDTNNPWMKRSLAKLRADRKKKTPGTTGKIVPEEVLLPFKQDWGEGKAKLNEDVCDTGNTTQNTSTPAPRKRIKKRVKKSLESAPEKIVRKKIEGQKAQAKQNKDESACKNDNLKDIDDLFESLDQTIIDSTTADLTYESNGKRAKKRVSFVDEIDNGLEETRTRRSTLAEVDSTPETTQKNNSKIKRRKKNENNKDEEVKDADVSGDMADPNKFLELDEKHVKQISSNMEENMNGEDGQESLIAEAFADDDVVGAFLTEKEKVAENEKIKDIDLTLPGWGSWAGHGMVNKKKKNSKFIIKAPEKERKDKMMPGVIISEKEDNSIRKFQPRIVAFPFTSADEFEASMSHPVGKEWNPETAHKMLTQPSIITKKGAIIRPIDKKSTFKKPGNNQSGLEWDSGQESD